MTTPQPRRHFNLDEPMETRDGPDVELRQRETFAPTDHHQPLPPLPRKKPSPRLGWARRANVAGDLCWRWQVAQPWGFLSLSPASPRP